MISLVIPVFNEEILIDQIFQRTINALKLITEDFEIIMVNDGSTDSTLAKLIEYHNIDNRFKVLNLSRNFGHQSAYTAGLNYAKGEFVIMMDGDMQDPPELIPSMYQKLIDSNSDIVYGKRIERNERLRKRFFIKLFHKFYKRISKLENINQVGNFSLMNRKAVKAFISLQEKNRYLPGLRSFIGFNQAYVEYSRPDREEGEAKMSSTKLIKLALDAIFSFSSIPVKFCLYSGLFGVIFIVLAVIYILIGKITGLAPLGWSSIILSIYFIGSVQLLSIGILGEYVYRIYKETQNRPIYIVTDFIQ